MHGSFRLLVTFQKIRRFRLKEHKDTRAKYLTSIYFMLFVDFSEFVSVSSMVPLENVWLLEAMRVQGLLYLTTMRCWIGPISPSLLEIFLAWCILEITAGRNISVLYLTQTPKRSLLLVTSRFTINSRWMVLVAIGWTHLSYETSHSRISQHKSNTCMSDDGTLLLTDEELTEVTSSVTRFFKPAPRWRRTANTTESSTAGEQSHTSSDDGIVRLQVHPEQQIEGGLRRSGRLQTAIVYDP